LKSQDAFGHVYALGDEGLTPKGPNDG